MTSHTTLTHGELFSGIGGFGLGAERAGLTTLWNCEKDKDCRKVLRHHWPTIPSFDDVEAMVAFSDQVKKVDVISAGSPCQGLSVAGRQEGLADERSGLFVRFTEIVEALDPRWAVWENVPGAFTSNKGEDFAAVLSLLLGSSEGLPVLPKKKGRASRTAGFAIGPNGSLAWRVLDARFFGVPQRRARILLVVDREGMEAGRVMFGDGFEAEVVLGEEPDVSLNESHVWCLDDGEVGVDSGEGLGIGRPDLAEILEGDVDETFFLSARAAAGILERTQRRQDRTGSRKNLPPVLEAALLMTAGRDVPETVAKTAALVIEERGPWVRDVNNAVVAKWFKGSSGPSGDEHHNMVAVAYPDPDGTLTTRYHKSLNTTLDDGAAVVTFRKSRRAQSTSDPESWVTDPTSNTLNTYDVGEVRATSLAVTFSITPESGANAADRAVEQDTANAITATSEAARNGRDTHVVTLPELRVRRLTPREAERLQGFPDDHTLVPANSNTSRYRQVGNAIAVPVATWVLTRIVEVDGR